MKFWLHVIGTWFNIVSHSLGIYLYCPKEYMSRSCAYFVVLGGMTFKSTYFPPETLVVLVHPYVASTLTAAVASRARLHRFA